MSEILAHNAQPIPGGAVSESLTDRMRNIIAHNKLAVAGAVIVSTGVVAVEGAQATENPLMQPPQPTLTATLTFENGRASAEDFMSDSSRATVLRNVKAKGTPKRLVRRAEKLGRCFKVGPGTKYPQVWVKGYNVDNVAMYGLDTKRRSRVCLIKGRYVRVNCDNEVEFEQPENVAPGTTYFVDSFNLKIPVKAEAYSFATCKVGDVSATAYGYGKAEARITARTLVRGKGKGKTLIEVLGSASGEAQAEATSKVSCEGGSGELTITEVPAPTPPTPPTPPKPPTKPPITCDPNPKSGYVCDDL